MEARLTIQNLLLDTIGRLHIQKGLKREYHIVEDTTHMFLVDNRGEGKEPDGNILDKKSIERDEVFDVAPALLNVGCTEVHLVGGEENQEQIWANM